jgi:ribosomal protein L11
MDLMDNEESIMRTRVATLSLIALFAAGVTQAAFAGEKLSPEGANPQRFASVTPTKSEAAPNADVTYKRTYDRKYNTTYYVAVQPQSEFVGTSAKAAATVKAKPSWNAFGHP